MKREKRPIRIGTRGSPLALWQARRVERALCRAFPDEEFVEVIVKTTGDVRRDRPLARLGRVGVFTRELDNALRAETIDLAVHSAKDYPTELAEGLCEAAYPCREVANDSLLGRRGRRLAHLRRGAVVGTESLRRSAQLLSLRPDLQFTGIRGNIETRLRKLEAGRYDAIFMAEAALRRLEMGEIPREVLAVSRVVPAVGQGALLIVCRSNDRWARRLAAQINDERVAVCVSAERAVLRGLGGGCRLPLGVYAKMVGDRMRLRAVVMAPDASRKASTVVEVGARENGQAARRAIRELMGKGARGILEQIKGERGA
jgi:hydroxymethylbilane synthase